MFQELYEMGYLEKKAEDPKVSFTRRAVGAGVKSWKKSPSGLRGFAKGVAGTAGVLGGVKLADRYDIVRTY